jgi:hypothetical protein
MDDSVNESEWIKLHCELERACDAEKINSFMIQHGHKKWDVRIKVCFFLIFLHLNSLKFNGAPVWHVRAAECDEYLLQWLAGKGIKLPALDAYV